MDDRSLPRIFLSPGEVAHAADATLISTVLGSCVTVTLWDAERRVGGMNHFVLPPGHGRASNARYGDVAMAQLLDGMLALGSRARGLQAKVFGGANVLAAGCSDSVGNANVEFALNSLAQRGIRVVAHRTGGKRGRFLVFNTGTGEAFVRWVAEGMYRRSRPHRSSEKVRRAG